MGTSAAEYIIGIDLGTTNSTLAYIKKPAEKHFLPDAQDLVQLPIEQTISVAQHQELFSLPSFLYLPLAEEIPHLALSWQTDSTFSIGAYAKKRSTEVPERTISSAKSWLCHEGINRRLSFLPLCENNDIEKISPVHSCSLFLSHLKKAWQHRHPDIVFEQQDIFVTIPASFHPSARELVLEAAQMAGFPEIVLLEEPQAAFYAWLFAHHDTWRKEIQPGDTLLVIDVGGGTTDFTVIKAEDSHGELALKRVAVGAHLLLGGDNFDLALAYSIGQKFESEGHRLDEWQERMLVHASREAKEALLSDSTNTKYEMVISGKGSKVIGRSIKTIVSKDEVESLLVDGFFPFVSAKEQSNTEQILGMKEIGLPYVQDPRITAQLAKFLSQTGETDNKSVDNFLIPTHLLFTGGSLKSKIFQKRLHTVLNQWAKECERPEVQVLEGQDYDFAVSRGACIFGLATLGVGVRIRSGASRSYFIGIEESRPSIPGVPPPIKALCVVPYGMEEGTEYFLEHQEFSLLLGENAHFRFFTRSSPTLSDGKEPVFGMQLRNVTRELQELHPIETHLEKGPDDGSFIHVRLLSRLSEIGTLELFCVAKDERKWKLEFDLRQPTESEIFT